MFCPDDVRKSLVRANGTLNGIDYVEVLDSAAPPGTPPQQTLLVHCLRPVTGLSGDNARVEGGVRITNIDVVFAFAASSADLATQLTPDENELLSLVRQLPTPDSVLVVRTDRTGDFSTYTLRLTAPGFDPLLSATPFTFKVECPSDFDCQPVVSALPPALAEPVIDYLARDYASFRQLMLDRLAAVMPQWTERNAADVGMAVVEVLAYAADQLSYFQDAVATEAYLDTARRRVSVRRHARLVDYFMQDGANARAWVSLTVAPAGGADGATLPAGTPLLSRESQSQPVVFETMHDVQLRASHNALAFYTWGDPTCVLPRGTLQATLRGGAELGLAAGDVLVFEEVLGADTGLAVDADPTHRHVVRLNADPVVRVDPLNGTTVTDVTWFDGDALPFDLSLRQFAAGAASVARANVVLADHGRTFTDDPLDPPQVPDAGRYRPVLNQVGLTQRAPFSNEDAQQRAAAEATVQDPRGVGPDIVLAGEGETWLPRRDLLGSDRFAPEFVVEMEDDGVAHLRFGDDVLGRAPSAGVALRATYRVGNGSSGNVGAGSISRVVSQFDGITSVTNPLPAVGGVEPEPLDQVRLYAPQAFRGQERAITAADYGAVAERHPEVQRAAATRRWTGSWYTMFVTVDRLGGRPVDAAFEAEMRAYLDQFRLAGHDLEIDGPRFVPLDIALSVCVSPGFYRSVVKQALLERFSNVDLASGVRGFFHPDNFTFSQPVYLSQIIAVAMATPGVTWVDAERFQRWGQPSRGELAAGRIGMGRLEIARLDNDLNHAENGRVAFTMQGGL